MVHDELDLPPGQAKLKFGGSAAGHNGLKDIHGQLGTPDYWRLRLGVGHPGDRAEVVNWVLKKPSPDHREAIHKAIEQSLGAVKLMLAGDMDKALQKVHAQPARPKPPRPPKPAVAAESTSTHTPTAPADAPKAAGPLPPPEPKA